MLLRTSLLCVWILCSESKEFSHAAKALLVFQTFILQFFCLSGSLHNCNDVACEYAKQGNTQVFYIHCHACSCKWKSNLNVFVFLCPQNTSCCRYTVRVLLEFNHVGTYNPCKGNHFTCYTVERFLLLSGVFKQWSCKEALFSNIVNITLLFCEQQNSQTRHYLNSHVLVHMQY